MTVVQFGDFGGTAAVWIVVEAKTERPCTRGRDRGVVGIPAFCRLGEAASKLLLTLVEGRGEDAVFRAFARFFRDLPPHPARWAFRMNLIFETVHNSFN